MPFVNRIRLPLYVKTPQFPTEANRFRLSDGTSKTLSVTIRKTYEVQTDYMGELTHQRLVVALNHDNVTIEGDKYIGGAVVDGDYEISWPEFLDYPLGQATVKIQVTPFDMTNSNCQTCEEISQLSLVDDDIGDIPEGTDKSINVFLNDNVCCFPITAEIVYYASGYLDGAVIDAATGIVTLSAKGVATPVGSIVLATYRVTCPNGAYDEADIYGTISGSGTECEQPGAILYDAISAPPPPYTIGVEWFTPAVDPADGYYWELYDAGDLGTPVQTGTTPDKTLSISMILPGTSYKLFVRSQCGSEVFSPYTELDFVTPAAATGTCGKFLISCDDGTLDTTIYNYSFMNCIGNIVSGSINNLASKEQCMMVDEFNIPVYFEADPPINYSYESEC